jgi:hypothetical protein
MKNTNIWMFVAFVLSTIIIAGCGTSPVVVNKEASVSAIRAAEEVGAADISNASLYLQLAKEELQKAITFAANGNKEQSESMLARAQADAELAVALSRSEVDKTESAKALERVKILRQENVISKKGSDL